MDKNKILTIIKENFKQQKIFLFEWMNLINRENLNLEFILKQNLIKTI